ncbi:BTB/POZ domain-containing protein At2g24240-like [Papaver somniferum]|uniref:BTB/POZ domain-containing protein At2g24240-like n=1 Tax=Papaver somniferum TaxID=3469 RepID=UPI000E6FC683|nr:BTB/POZ domain-containing protein At2g24240-like [Papaver somniferum]
MGTQTDKVRFNVRGKIFETTVTTLASVSRNSMFGAMLDDEWNLQPTEVNKEYFIDRNPDCFSVLLDLLGTGELYVPPHIPDKLLYRGGHYYGILDHVRRAKWGSFDGNRLSLACRVCGQPPGNCSAIRASPDGGCAIAHGSIVRVYDWMLEEHPPLNLDYQVVNDIGWIDSDNIVMSVCQNLSKGVGGMGLFSSSTGKLRQRFQLNDEKDEVQGFTAGALCFNSDSKIFASCIKTSNDGIGLWDQVTGKTIDFFDSSNGLGLGNAAKIKWLKESNCLFVCTSDQINSCIYLLDFRDKSIVLSRSMGEKTSGSYFYVVDAVPVEEQNCFCVVLNNEDLGFVDMRSVGLTST